MFSKMMFLKVVRVRKFNLNIMVSFMTLRTKQPHKICQLLLQRREIMRKVIERESEKLESTSV